MVQHGARSILLVPLVRALRLPKKSKKNKKTKRGKCRARSLRVGASSLESKVSYVHCSVPASSWESSFAGFQSCSGVARSFVCITAYNQPLPSLQTVLPRCLIRIRR